MKNVERTQQTQSAVKYQLLQNNNRMFCGETRADVYMHKQTHTHTQLHRHNLWWVSDRRRYRVLMIDFRQWKSVVRRKQLKYNQQLFYRLFTVSFARFFSSIHLFTCSMHLHRRSKRKEWTKNSHIKARNSFRFHSTQSRHTSQHTILFALLFHQNKNAKENK